MMTSNNEESKFLTRLRICSDRSGLLMFTYAIRALFFHCISHANSLDAVKHMWSFKQAVQGICCLIL